MDSNLPLSKDSLLLFWVYLQGWDDFEELTEADREAIIDNFMENHTKMSQGEYVRSQIDGILKKYGAEITVSWEMSGDEAKIWPVISIDGETIPL